MDRTINFGKYKGEYITTIIDKDPQYIQWAYTNTEKLLLTEEEKYLLYTRLSNDGILDKELLADINEFPKIEVEGSLDKDALKQIIAPIASSPLYEQRRPIKDEYDILASNCDRIAWAYGKADPTSYNYNLRQISEGLSNLIRKSKYVSSRPNFSEEQKESARQLIETIGKIVPMVDSFFVSYTDKMQEISRKIGERYRVKELQIAAREQEKLKAERNAAVDKQPYKDMDETFIVKLDDILGHGEYKISQCIYKIDLEKDSISSSELRHLRNVFGESRIEVRDNKEDKLSVYLTQYINTSSTASRESRNYLETAHQFIQYLEPEQREHLFSLGKVESRQVLDNAIDYFEKYGEFPSYDKLFNNDAFEKITVKDVEKWLNKISEEDMKELSRFMGTDWKVKEDKDQEDEILGSRIGGTADKEDQESPLGDLPF